MAQTKERREQNRTTVTAWLDAYMADIQCAECGAQPIEWHYEGHPDQPNSRVSSLRTQGASIERIKTEIDRCTPLCRSCHMRIDGRTELLHKNKPRQPGSRFVPDERPCSCCGESVKQPRRGLCYACYVHQMGIRLRKNPTCDGCCVPTPSAGLG